MKNRPNLDYQRELKQNSPREEFSKKTSEESKKESNIEFPG